MSTCEGKDENLSCGAFEASSVVCHLGKSFMCGIDECCDCEVIYGKCEMSVDRYMGEKTIYISACFIMLTGVVAYGT